MSFIRTIFKGSLGAVENWSVGINWGIFGLSPDAPDQAEVDGILAALRGTSAVTSLQPALLTLLSTSANVNAIRVEKRAEDEQILSVAEGLLTTPTTGTGTASKTPQDAYVFSLRTNTPGARGRGRIYWPALGAGLSGTFQISTPTVATVSAQTKIWLQAIGTAMNGYYASISSPKTVVLSVRSVTDHVCRDVTQLQFGSILDTQRRRRDALPETYTSVVYP